MKNIWLRVKSLSSPLKRIFTLTQIYKKTHHRDGFSVCQIVILIITSSVFLSSSLNVPFSAQQYTAQDGLQCYQHLRPMSGRW